MPLEGLGEIGGMEDAAISLVAGKRKELYSCRAEEGAVEKGSDLTS